MHKSCWLPFDARVWLLKSLRISGRDEGSHRKLPSPHTCLAELQARVERTTWGGQPPKRPPPQTTLAQINANGAGETGWRKFLRRTIALLPLLSFSLFLFLFLYHFLILFCIFFLLCFLLPLCTLFFRALPYLSLSFHGSFSFSFLLCVDCNLFFLFSFP